MCIDRGLLLSHSRLINETDLLLGKYCLTKQIWFEHRHTDKGCVFDIFSKPSKWLKNPYYPVEIWLN